MTDDKNLPATAEPQQSRQLTAGDIWTGLAAMAENDSIPVDKLRALADIQKDVMESARIEDDRTAKRKWDNAFARACAEMPVITKDEKIEHNGKFIGWFRKYEDIREIVDEICRKYNLTISHDSADIDGGKAGLNIWTVISYVDSDHTWTETRGRMPIPPDAGGAKGAAQAIGSSMTYGQRYSLCAAFGIVTKGLDRDGSTNVAKLPKPGDETNLLSDATEAAGRGVLPYKAFFEGLTNVQRGWMVANGGDAEFLSHHERLKHAATQND